MAGLVVTFELLDTYDTKVIGEDLGRARQAHDELVERTEFLEAIVGPWYEQNRDRPSEFQADAGDGYRLPALSQPAGRCDQPQLCPQTGMVPTTQAVGREPEAGRAALDP